MKRGQYLTWPMVKDSPRGVTEFLVESNRIEGIDIGDITNALFGRISAFKKENRHGYNSILALKFVVDHYQEELTVEKLLKLHAIQMDGTMPVPEGKKRRFKAGVFREQPVYIRSTTVGGHVSTQEKVSYTRIPTLINEFLYHFNDNDRAFGYSHFISLRTHYHFECIHPFMDGNGRVGRLLWLWDWLRNEGTKGSILGGVGSILDFFEDNSLNIRFPENIPVDERDDSFLSKRQRYYDAIGAYERELGWISESDAANEAAYKEERILAMLMAAEQSSSRRTR